MATKIGHCIYCGATEIPLTKEHVVPFALGGDLVLTDASCKPCAKITGTEIEQHILRNTFGNLRIRHNFPTRHLKERPTQFSITVGNGDDQVNHKVDVSSLPYASWALPRWDMPWILQYVPPEKQHQGIIQFSVAADDASHILRFGNGLLPVGSTLGSINLNLFRRFVAKIAHAFAYSILGTSFTPCLQPLILKGHSNPGIWIGGEGVNAKQPNDDTVIFLQLGILELWTKEKYLAVRIRLFGFLGTPTYIACVGQSKIENFELPQDAVYAKYVKVTFTTR